MTIDMPLPMPRWLISSPIHISTAVPATSVGMIEVAARPDAVGEQRHGRRLAAAEKNAVPRPVPKMNTSTGGLQRRQRRS